MALLSYEVIQEIRGIADAYERTERKRLERVKSLRVERVRRRSDETQEAAPSGG